MKTTTPPDYPKTFNEWVDKVLVEPKPKEPEVLSETEVSEGRRMVDAALELA